MHPPLYYNLSICGMGVGGCFRKIVSETDSRGEGFVECVLFRNIGSETDSRGEGCVECVDSLNTKKQNGLLGAV